MATASQIIAERRWRVLPAFRIVVGVDYSRASKRALDEAMWLAAERGGAVLALQVLPAQRRDAEDFLERHKQHRLKLERYCEARRASLLLEQVGAAGFGIDAHVRYGRPDVQIRDFATRVEAQLIVVGMASPRSRWQRALRPPVTDSLVNRAPCPVFVAREISTMSARLGPLPRLAAAAIRSA